MLDMVRSGCRLPPVPLGLGGVEHDRIWESGEVADALVGISQRRTPGDGHPLRLLHRRRNFLRIHVRPRADPGHGG